MQGVRAVVGRQVVPLPVQLETRPRDAVRDPADRAAEVRIARPVRIGRQIGQPEMHIAELAQTVGNTNTR